ncbi:sigma-70 family RNA polymerase sigma factor [Peptoniphilus indolicus]|uniref:RNA polymerase ECF-type sigma factor n=2 Tax=Peptoniphilus indolicus TaxID=33030 RepID=G4D1V5_9FIRM|nr:sigma-70 family RNA polymerase sigma factor [Peptoniphilus indolicus]EGY80498.1 RNA polymerase ECF-type sigma factor [Peptoniphilus indolicus ATCC 29427]SUB75532.1 RNA polymerase sigma factor sigV [Peptoniphilus indolicus]
MGVNEDFKNLMENREDKLYKIAFTYLRNRDDSMDCVQETLLKGLKNYHTLQNKKYFDTWIIRILINTCIDYINKNKSTVQLNEEITREEIIENYEDTIDLINAIGELKSEQRELIFLKYFKGYSNFEIAREMNIKEGTVKSRVHRILKKLKFSME